MRLARLCELLAIAAETVERQKEIADARAVERQGHPARLTEPLRRAAVSLGPVTSGLTEAEAAARLAARGEPREPPASRSTSTIVRANVDHAVQRDPPRARPPHARLRRLARRALPRDHRHEHRDRDLAGAPREAEARRACRARGAARDGRPGRRASVAPRLGGRRRRPRPARARRPGRRRRPARCPSTGLQLDESILTGEATAVAARSGTRCGRARSSSRARGRSRSRPSAPRATPSASRERPASSAIRARRSSARSTGSSTCCSP